MAARSRAGVTIEGAPCHVAGRELPVERFERLHDLDLAVLELADVAGEVLHLLVHGLELAATPPPGR